MLYLIIEDELGIEFPVFCLAPQTFDQLAVAWRRNDRSRIVSAGYCEFVSPVPAETAWGVRVFGDNVFRGMGNRGTKDAALISVMYQGTVAMAIKGDSWRPPVELSCTSCGAPVSYPGHCGDCLHRQHQEAIAEDATARTQ